MKKIFNKIPKKVKYTTVAILLLVLMIADAKCSQSFKGQEHKKGTVDTISVIESEQPAPEPSLESFEELQDDYEKDGNDSSTTIEEIDDTEEENQNSGSGDASEKGSKVSGTEDSVGTNKGKTVIIDESKETMKDETGNSEEKEYDANQEPQGKLILTKPKEKEGGKEFVDKTKPGGKKGVGVWS